MKEYLINNVLRTNGRINHHALKRLSDEQINEIKELTDFSPDSTPLQIRIKFILEGVTEYPKCVICGDKVRQHHKNLRLLDTCSPDCDYKLRVRLTKESNLRTYGVESTNVLESVKKKQRDSMLKNHGVEYYVTSNEFYDKASKTNLNNLGVPNPMQSKAVQNKVAKTKLERYGDERYNNHEKFIETCIERYGVEHVMQDKEIFERQQKECYGSKKYKHLYYRGTYERLFIKEYENRFPIESLENCFAVKYTYDDKEHVYFPDFLITTNNLIVEIKSSWTYDNNGKNESLREINHAKWEAAKSLEGFKFIALKSKGEIKNYFELLEQLI